VYLWHNQCTILVTLAALSPVECAKWFPWLTLGLSLARLSHFNLFHNRLESNANANYLKSSSNLWQMQPDRFCFCDYCAKCFFFVVSHQPLVFLAIIIIIIQMESGSGFVIVSKVTLWLWAGCYRDGDMAIWRYGGETIHWFQMFHGERITG